ncbi:hypothetical protein [Nocardia nova]|uniref:hypothetical protein n=1 Tax=Nocardia nova TaxID=37330 RepID=UPI0033E178AA
MSETYERTDVSATLEHIDPRLVRVLKHAAELAAENGYTLGSHHVAVALIEDGLFDRWWPQAGQTPDPHDGYLRVGGPTQAVTLEEWKQVAVTMTPPAHPGGMRAEESIVDYRVTGPDAEEYRALIEPPNPSNRPRRYADRDQA